MQKVYREIIKVRRQLSTIININDSKAKISSWLNTSTTIVTGWLTSSKKFSYWWVLSLNNSRKARKRRKKETRVNKNSQIRLSADMKKRTPNSRRSLLVAKAQMQHQSLVILRWLPPCWAQWALPKTNALKPNLVKIKTSTKFPPCTEINLTNNLRKIKKVQRG